MERKEAIRSAYRLTGSSSFYDGMMTCSTLPGRLVCRLDYDFSLADNDAAMHSGVIARTIVLDRLVGEYLAAHPGATVMNLACGLDTRCYRMQGYAHWYNLDLPETIAVREALLPESGSISQLAMSAMDDWGAAVEGPSGPALVIIEGLTMYLTQADVQRIFAVIAGRFPAATVFTHGRQTLQGKIDRGQQGKIHLGRQGRPGARRPAAGLPACGRALPDRRHGGLRARLPAAR